MVVHSKVATLDKIVGYYYEIQVNYPENHKERAKIGEQIKRIKLKYSGEFSKIV